jgi:cell division protease FtsH
MDASGRLVPNGQPAQLRPYAFAMSAPAASSVGSPDLASTIDREVRKILDEGHAMARRILQEHAGQLQNLADALMEHEQLDRAQFESLLQA